MLQLIRSRKAQNTMEYALLIAVVIGVFSAMQLYTRRSLQAKLKNSTDTIHNVVLQDSEVAGKTQAMFGAETQYEPYYLTKGSSSSATTSSEGIEAGVVTDKGGKKEVSGATVTRTGSQTVTGASSAASPTTP